MGDFVNDDGTFYGAIGGSSYPTYSDGGGSSFNWGSLIAPLTTSAASILGTRYAVPQLNPGQLIQGNGMLMYQGANGSTMPSIASLTGGSSSSLLLIGGAALIAVLMMMKK